MSAVINKCCTISSYLAVSKDFIENQRKNCRLFSLETRSSKLWFVKCTKMIKKNWHPCFKKLFIIVYVAVTITTLTRFANGFISFFEDEKIKNKKLC